MQGSNSGLLSPIRVGERGSVGVLGLDFSFQGLWGGSRRLGSKGPGQRWQERGRLEPGVNCRGAWGPTPGRGLWICGSKTSVILGLRGTRRDSVPDKPPLVVQHVTYGLPSQPPLYCSAGLPWQASVPGRGHMFGHPRKPISLTGFTGNMDGVDTGGGEWGGQGPGVGIDGTGGGEGLGPGRREAQLRLQGHRGADGIAQVG